MQRTGSGVSYSCRYQREAVGIVYLDCCRGRDSGRGVPQQLYISGKCEKCTTAALGLKTRGEVYCNSCTSQEKWRMCATAALGLKTMGEVYHNSCMSQDNERGVPQLL